MRTTPTMPTEERSPERRALPRHSVLFRTVLIDSEIDGESAEITNIARSGFLARTGINRIKGSVVKLDMPGLGEVKATVVWCGNGLLGAHFQQPMEEAAFTELLNGLT
ncbi:MAG: hypothetical protein U1E64_05840 [Sphingomonadaceae bacterium]